MAALDETSSGHTLCYICVKQKGTDNAALATLYCDRCNKPVCSDHFQLVGQNVFCDECLVKIARKPYQK